MFKYNFSNAKESGINTKIAGLPISDYKLRLQDIVYISGSYNTINTATITKIIVQCMSLLIIDRRKPMCKLFSLEMVVDGTCIMYISLHGHITVSARYETFAEMFVPFTDPDFPLLEMRYHYKFISL